MRVMKNQIIWGTKYFIGMEKRKGINALKLFFRIILIPAVNGWAMDVNGWAMISVAQGFSPDGIDVVCEDSQT